MRLKNRKELKDQIVYWFSRNGFIFKPIAGFFALFALLINFGALSATTIPTIAIWYIGNVSLVGLTVYFVYKFFFTKDDQNAN